MALLRDGFSTIINLTQAGVLFEEKEIDPPGLSGGGPNDVTGMRAIRYRHKYPKKLISGEKMTLTIFYDPAYLTQAIASLQVNQLIAVTFPNTHTWSFWGWLDEFKPDKIKEGEAPTASITIEVSNINEGTQTEQGPIYA